MTQYVEIAVNVPQVSGVFHYHLPPELEGRVNPGQLVVVPFGQQTVQGVVLRFIDEPEVTYTKPVEAVLDEQVVLTASQIRLAEYLSQSTLAPLAACIGLMMPPGIGQLADTLYSLSEQEISHDLELNGTQSQVIELLRKRGPLRGRQIDRSLPRRNWRPLARKLVEARILESQAVLPPPRVRPKYIRTAQLSVLPEMVCAGMQGLSSVESAQMRRQRLLQVLADKSEPVDVNWLYAEMVAGLKSGDAEKEKPKLLSDLVKLHELELVMLREEEAWRDPLAELAYNPAYPPKLTTDQQKAWQQIQAGLEAAAQGENVKPFLVYGVTGSGKTELYLRAVAETLKRGKQAIVLVPEIALTPADHPALHGALPRPGGRSALRPVGRRALRHLAARPPGETQCDRRAAQRPVFTAAGYRRDRARRVARRLLLPG